MKIIKENFLLGDNILPLCMNFVMRKLIWSLSGLKRFQRLTSTWTLKLSDFPHQSEKIILRQNLARVCLEKMHKLNF